MPFNKQDTLLLKEHELKPCLGKGATNINILLPPHYHLLTSTEKEEYMWKIGKALIRLKAAYYLFDSPLLSDMEYDFLERLYEAVCRDIGQNAIITDMVGINLDIQECLDAYNELLHMGLVPKKVL